MVMNMNREEFLRQLEVLLTGISEEERQDAMAFYRSYFDEAEGSEEDVIKELGSPQKAAESILKNLGMDGTTTYMQQPEKKKSSWTPAVIVLLVLTSPIWLVGLLVIASILLALVVAAFSVAVAVVAVMAALVVTGFVLIGIGLSVAFTGTLALGMGLIGGGLLVLALGVLSVVLVVWIFGWFLPWALKGIWKLCKMPFEKRKERQGC